MKFSDVQATPRSVREMSDEELLEIFQRGQGERESGEDDTYRLLHR